MIGVLNFVRVLLWFFAMKSFFLGEFGFLAKSEIIFTILLGITFLSERFRGLEIFFLFSAILGISLVSFRSGDFLFLPTLAIFFAQFSMAIQNILSKKNDHIDSFVFTFWRAVMTEFFLIFYLLIFEDIQKSFGEIYANPYWTAFVIIEGFFAILLMRGLFYVAMKHFPAGKTSIFFSFTSFLTLLLGHIFFGEKLFWWQLLGGVILITSIVFLMKLHYLEDDSKELAAVSSNCDRC